MRPIIIAFVVCAMNGWLPGQVLPDGFIDELLASGFDQPVGLAQLPDGRILVIERQTGAIKVVASGQVGTIGMVGPLSLGPERGLLGIAVDPLWPFWPFIYVHYCHAGTGKIRVSRFPVNGALSNPTVINLSLGAEYVVMDDLPDASPLHNGGTLRFDSQGMLYVSVGDDMDLCGSQDPSGQVGRILRVDVQPLPFSGAGPPPKALLVPPGNPFNGPSDEARLTWALGLRNPFRFQIDPATDRLFIADVGSFLAEEINISTTGGENFGWPWVEGNQPVNSCTTPTGLLTPATVEYPRAGTFGLASFISMAFYRSQPGAQWSFGPGYEGSLFYLDYYLGFIRRLSWDGQQWSAPPAVPGQPGPGDWAYGYDFVSDGLVASDGRIVYVRMVPGELRAIRPVPPSPPSTALTIVSGDGQSVNAGQIALEPLVVKLVDTQGNPVAGAPITFQLTAGQGTLGLQTAITDALGEAVNTFAIGSAFSGHPVITAHEPGGATATFQLRWRGLLAQAVQNVSGAVIYLKVLHSQTSSPFTIAFDAPGQAPVPTFVGVVETSIFAPQPSLLVLDGLGLVGPVQPQFLTDPLEPEWEIVFDLPPGLSGLSLVAQAYAVDSALLPTHHAVMISNTVPLTLP